MVVFAVVLFQVLPDSFQWGSFTKENLPNQAHVLERLKIDASDVRSYRVNVMES